MTMRKASLAIVVATLATFSANANPLLIEAANTYNKYEEGAERNQAGDLDMMYFMGFMKGFSHYILDREYVCVPEGVNHKQVNDIVARYIGKHVERHHESGAVLVLDAIAEAFPCKG